MTMMALRGLWNKVGRGLRRRARAMPARIADRLAGGPWIDALRDRRYDLALRRHRPSLPGLGAPWAGIAQALQARGIAQTDLRRLALPGSHAMFETARALAGRWMVEFRRQAGAGIDYVIVPPMALAAEPEIFRFGLSDPLLALAEAYIGLPVAYDGVTLQYTAADGRAASTREWHRDREDRRMIKFVIYLTDVDGEGSPFQLVPASGSGRGQGASFYPDTPQRAEGLGSPISCEGFAGTAVFADTAGHFHRGKPAARHDRAALFFSYFARVPKRPYFCRRSGLSDRQIASLVERATPDQRAAALWQAALPLPWRLIPAEDL